MSINRYTLPVAVFLIMRQGGKILLARRKNTGWYDGSYDLPAGHIEGGEPMRQAAAREAKEELGINVELGDVTFDAMLHGYFADDDKEYIYVFFEVRKWQGTPKIMESDKCEGLQWFAADALPENLTPGTKAGLAAHISGKSYSEVGFSEKSV